MHLSKRVVTRLAVAGGVLAALIVPNTAQAESCTPLPVNTTGVTVEVAGKSVRVPSISGVAVCTQSAGLVGLPTVSTAAGNGCLEACVSVLLRGGSDADGYVSVRYSLDGVPADVRVPLPGTGSGGSDTCLVGIGAPTARADCLAKVSLDDIPPPPTAPPIPSDPWCNEYYCVNEPPDPICNDTYCIDDPDTIDPYCNQYYCLADPPQPICLKTPRICIP